LAVPTLEIASIPFHSQTKYQYRTNETNPIAAKTNEKHKTEGYVSNVQ
jgi:hypothetical protein